MTRRRIESWEDFDEAVEELWSLGYEITALALDFLASKIKEEE